MVSIPIAMGLIALTLSNSWAEFVILSEPPVRIGIIGDSLCTGAATDPRLSIDACILFGRFASMLLPGDVEPEKGNYPEVFRDRLSDPPLTISRQFHSAKEIGKYGRVGTWFEQRGSQALDLEEYSWSYFLGLIWNLAPSNILMVAQDGARVRTIPTQFERLHELSPDFLPEVIFVFFNANDMCKENIFSRSHENIFTEYKSNLKQTLAAEMASSRAPPQGTDIILAAPVDAVQVLKNPDILRAERPFAGQKLSCREIRNHRPKRELPLVGDVYSFVESMCPAILKTSLDDTAKIEFLTAVHADFVRAQDEVVRELGAQNGFRLHFIRETANILFAGEDVANDCFHPSISGQEKIAQVIGGQIRIKPEAGLR